VTNEQVGLVIAGAVALVALLASVLAWRRAARSEARARVLHERVALLESAIASAAPGEVDRVDPATHVITRLDEEHAAPGPITAQRIEGRLFADIVARETVVKAAAWTRGVRHALAPETRNRIRFQMRQETKRVGRERRAEMKVALREHRARRRAAADADPAMREDVA